MKKVIILVFVVTIIVTTNACRKEEPKQNQVQYNPTSLTVEVPSFVKNYVGDIKHPVDNPLTVEGVALGRKLFYEKMLSDNMTISCGTCHKQENAFDDPRPFSQGTNGAFGDRNAMAIINLAWNTAFFWDGRRATMEEQAHDPVTNPIEMANTWPEVVRRLQNSSTYPDLFYQAFGTRTIDSNLVVKAIAQFERTLVSYNSRFDKYFHKGDSTIFTQQEKNGLAIFKGKGMCNNCHLMNTQLADNIFRNNGLDANPKDAGLMKFTGLPSDRGKFKVPTLRNIAKTAPYMHDSRFATLEQVIDFYSNDVQQSSPNIDEHMPDYKSGLKLTMQEKSDLIAFLHTLTDQDFLTNPAFSEPK